MPTFSGNVCIGLILSFLRISACAGTREGIFCVRRSSSPYSTTCNVCTTSILGKVRLGEWDNEGRALWIGMENTNTLLFKL